MPLLLGVDVGTTLVKALVTDASGQVLSQAVHRIDLHHPQPGWAEQDPEDWWRGLTAAVRGATEGVDRSQIVSMALSTQGGAQTVVDDQGRPLRQARAWMDTRAAAEADALNAEVGERTWYERTGKRMSATNTVSFPRWLEAHEPQVFRSGRRFTEVQDLLVHRLTGEWRMDVSSAAYCGAFRQADGCWDPELLAASHLTPEQLSPICGSGEPVGALLPDAAQALGLSTQVIVCSGAHDQTAAALGVAAVAPGQAVLSGGTAWVLYAVTDRYRPGENTELLLLRHAVPELRCVLAAWAGCSVLDWFVRECCEADRRDAAAAGADVYDELLTRSSDAPPLMVLPYFYGGGGHAGARGAVVGLSLSHTRRDLVRAAAEGITFEARRNLVALSAAGARVDRLTMIGGAAKSRVWPQIVADVCNLAVTTPRITDAASLGAAILAGHGAGVIEGWRFAAPESAPAHAYEPDAASVERYAALYDVFGQTFRAGLAASTRLIAAGATP